jgi:hypothetical protein
MSCIYIVSKQSASVVNNLTLVGNTVEEQEDGITLPMVEQCMLSDDQGLGIYV